ncbi:Ulp1 family isopeptidase [Bradyrhizobium sp. ARR65]|uniref:Ulp1 family isopeptidase n=1 Tax=Bradyrhizobium sp. ARR65 TaxID=1040989 RepID=UPI0018DD4883|nr:Ulp1 family isopeptidase [Bradyrhizobium sp. ARR65]
MEDFTHIVALGWDHSCQSAPDALIGSLNRKGLLPATPFQSRAHFYIHGRPYTTKLGNEAREPTPNNPGGLSVTLIPGHGLESHQPVLADIESFPGHGEETSSSSRAAVSTMRTKGAKGCGLWSCFKSGLGKLRGSRHENSSGRLDQADEHASGSAIPVQPPLALGHTECLGDEHITADYTLLERELRREYPDLAARIRFVQPAQAHLLRLTNEANVEEEILREINGHGDDTADFLFVPVSNAGVVLNSGRHWTLLLVDRRDPEGIVAYHYDSLPRDSQREVARQLAVKLGARLETAKMTRQPNMHDCGVFVVDGTRALANRLAEGQRPPLHLDKLIANRRALQDRLSGPAHLRRRTR